MEKYLQLIYIFTFFFIASCSNEEEIVEAEIYRGEAIANINGETIIFKPRMKLNTNGETYGILLSYFNNNNILRKELHFAFVKETTTKQMLFQVLFSSQDTTQCSYSTNILDGDVAGNYYWLNEEDAIEDYIILTKFDETTGDVIGDFQASFYVDTMAIFDPDSPDTIIITDGHFETRVFE